MDKALTMFGGTNGVCTVQAIKDTFKRVLAGEIESTEKFDTPNFEFRAYKKGTIHLFFKDLDALARINRYAAERRMFVLGSGN